MSTTEMMKRNEYLSKVEDAGIRSKLKDAFNNSKFWFIASSLKLNKQSNG